MLCRAKERREKEKGPVFHLALVVESLLVPGKIELDRARWPL